MCLYIYTTVGLEPFEARELERLVRQAGLQTHVVEA